MKKGTTLNLPNKLTLGRIFLVPLLVVFLISSSQINRIIATAIFLAASFTDWLDGHIARRTRQITSLGKLLDPLADKLLVCAAFISLVQSGQIPAWMVVVIVCRELAITGLRGIAASREVVVASSWWGKYKMLSQILAIVLLILQAPHALIVAWLALILTVVSGLDYAGKFLRSSLE
ncbi:MAG: CDP-diacylglycerol--glycerol-3-phosphate 3-phosphatidyltransferase [candidate division NC10 bacterium]|nr:CDP-diacylglycerol--glycerol-3-phosphate 3-phosphatidyltransferase [candidate division NC10 bacterium]